VQNLLLPLFCLFLLPLFAQVQTVEDDFEGNGTILSWYGDDCGMDNAAANPFPQGSNTSATVLAYTDAGGLYANVGFNVSDNFNLSVNHTFSLKIYVPGSSITGQQPRQLSLKLQNGTLEQPWSTQSEIIKPIVLDQWQTITFDFANDAFLNLEPGSPAPTSRTDFNRIILQVNGENNNDLVVAYLDDFLYDGTIGYEFDPSNSIYNQLVWSDEFSGSGAVDATKWHHQTRLPNGESWFNGEAQHYTNRTANSSVADGFLTIMAKKEQFTDQGQTKSYTSARLNSKFAFTYGRVEVRAKLPIGLGTWPAIWMLGKNINEPGGYWASTHGTTSWPACGEIDIMEHWGYNQNYVQSALHTPSSFGGTVNLGGIWATDVSNVFHVYALEWSPEAMEFSIDGNVYYTYAPNPQNAATWPFDADQYLLLNVAMSGSIAPNFTQSPMVVDYVRVYQESPTATAESAALPNVRLFPNPVVDKLNMRVPASLLGAQVTVYTALGQAIATFIQEEATMTLDWSAYPQGTYSLTYTTSAGQTTYKVVKL